MPRGCGSCNLCCKLLKVADIGKPAQMLCWWTGLHGGCERQKDKPFNLVFDEKTGEFSLGEGEKDKDLALASCAQFTCLWLASQSRTDPGEVMPRHWRPDISHVVIGPFDPNDRTKAFIQVDPDHPAAWKNPELAAYFDRMIDRGCTVEIVLGEQRFPYERDSSV